MGCVFLFITIHYNEKAYREKNNEQIEKNQPQFVAVMGDTFYIASEEYVTIRLENGNVNSNLVNSEIEAVFLVEVIQDGQSQNTIPMQRTLRCENGKYDSERGCFILDIPRDINKYKNIGAEKWKENNPDAGEETSFITHILFYLNCGNEDINGHFSFQVNEDGCDTVIKPDEKRLKELLNAIDW